MPGTAPRCSPSACGSEAGAPVRLVLSVNDTDVGTADDLAGTLPEGAAGVYPWSKAGRSTVNVLTFSVRPATPA